MSSAEFPAIVLVRGKEKSAIRNHPWIFSGAIQHVIGNPQSGETVEVRSAQGEFLGSDAYSPA